MEKQQCKSCGKDTYNTFGYHSACYKTRMHETDYVDPKMDDELYPINFDFPQEIKCQADMFGDLYRELGMTAGSNWIKQNVYKDIDMEEIYEQIMEGKLRYDE